MRYVLPKMKQRCAKIKTGVKLENVCDSYEKFSHVVKINDENFWRPPRKEIVFKSGPN